MRHRSVLIVLVLGAAVAGLALGGFAPACPSAAALDRYRAPEATSVYAADGSLIANLSPQRRRVVELDEISPLLRDGIVAVEDRRFFEHGGVDYRGVVRAAWRNLTSLSIREGFSTLTMQLARNVFPDELPRSDKLRRKMCEVRMAYNIEERMGKDEILARYLNQIYLGEGLYGVEAAAQGYFGTSAERLTAERAALLIGLAQAPEGYNPRENPLAAVRRRNVVLDVMAREGVISADEAEQAKEARLALAPPRESAGPAPYLVAAVRRELQDRFGPDAHTRGLQVYTGLDPDLQRAAHETVVAQIRRIEDGTYGRYDHPTPDADLEAGTGDGSPYLQGAIVALDPRTGAVRALVGGRDFVHSQYDRALRARRQPGSAFKPVVYAGAVRAGLPLTARVRTTPVSVDDGDATAWRPGDHVPDSIRTMPLRNALAASSNNAAVRVGHWAGTQRVIETARDLGISTPIPRYPSIYLGSAEVAPAELVAAYAAFGNGGRRVQPQLVTRVEDDRGEVLWRAEAPSARALDEGTAYLMLSMLRDVVDRGTGTSVRGAGFELPAAGKTGTTNDGKDVWFIGLTPDLVAGVWLGFDRPQSIVAGASGGRLAAPVWAEMMKSAYRDRPAPRDWTPPATLSRVAVDTTTGRIATGNCPDRAVVEEYFLAGTAPTETCPTHPEGTVERFFERAWDGIRGIFGGGSDADSTSRQRR